MMDYAGVFRKIVDAADSPTGDAAWEALGLDPEGFEGSLHDLISARFEQALGRAPDAGGTPQRPTRDIARGLILDHHINGAPLDPAFSSLTAVSGRISSVWQGVALLSDTEAWTRALEIARAAEVVLGRTSANVQNDTHHLSYQREHAVGRAAVRLRSVGVHVTYQEGELDLSDLDQAGDTLAGWCERLGGVRLAEALFDRLAPLYDKTQRRYHHVRVAPTLPQKRGSLIPAGYVLQLAARTAYRPSYAGRDWRQLANAAFDLAADIVAVLDVEPYSMWPGIYQTGETIIEHLQKIAIFDHAVALRQLRPTDVERLLCGLFDWVDDDLAREHLGWTVREAAKVLGALFWEGSRRRGPFTFTLGKAVSLANGTARRTVEAVLGAATHAEPVNAEYEMPTDAAKADFGFRPFVRTSAGMYVMLDASACAYAAYEAVAAALRGALNDDKDCVFGDVQMEIGDATERFLRCELKAHGVSVVEGKYTHAVAEGPDEDGECDAVAVTDDQITFIESKLKVLRRASSGGDDFRMLVDLGKSVFAAQLQAGHHERRLIEAGEIRFASGEVLERRNRKIERVAMTLLDYGGYQDRRVLHLLMTLLRGMGLSLDRKESPTETEAREELEAQLREVHEQVLSLEALEPEREGQHYTFMNCWFLSLPQMLVLLDGVQSGADFDANLRRTRHVTTGSMDFYSEYARMAR